MNDKKMGRKGSWFSSVKKALSPSSKKQKDKKADISKKELFPNDKPSVSHYPTVEVSHPHPLPPLEDVKLIESENEQTKHAYSVAASTTAAAEAAQAAAEVVRVTTVSKFDGKSVEEVAAIRIQTRFRGYLARRALRALRGLVRLKAVVDGPTVKRQTANTLKHMQTLSRVHSQIQSRRFRMAEENRALQRQILQKRAKELESLRMGEDWNDSLQSKEKIEANLLHKYEAAMKRERALAYSYTHQQTWKKSARSNNLLFMDPTNPQWGWSWLERYMAARPWENQSTSDKDKNRYCLSIKSAGGEITKSFARHQLNSSDNQSSPTSQRASKPASPMASKKIKPASPGGSMISQDDDSRSVLSIQSNRRHTIGGGSSVRDDSESLASSPSVPSYMASTRSAKAKSRLSCPVVPENGDVGPEKGLVGTAKKRLSFPPSPARVPRRHSGPPKGESSSIIDKDHMNGVVS